MSFWYGDVKLPNPQSIAGGEAPLEEVFNAAFEQMRFVDNTNANERALYRAYDERIKAIQDLTGEARENPLRKAAQRQASAEAGDAFRFSATPRHKRAPLPDYRAEEVQGFNDWLSAMEGRHPEAVGAIRANIPVDRDAEAITRAADERLGRAMASRGGVMKWLTTLGGGMAGAMTDPVQVATMFAGGGAGGARTVATRIISTALREAAVNAGIEAAMQPAVQDWRGRAGLPSGMDEALQNIGFAGLAGGVLGGGMRALGELGGALARRGEAAQISSPREVEASAAVDASFAGQRAATTGELAADPGARAIEALRPHRDRLPPEVRGAIDAAEMAEHQATLRPAALSPDLHDVNLDRATAAALNNETFVPEIDAEQVERVVSRLVPEAAPAEQAGESLQRFLMRSGGVKDFKGEMEALGLSRVSERFVGRLVRADGLPLDEARRLAAEAGFLNHRYGTPEEAMARSTVNDLLDELDVAQRESGPDGRPDDGGRIYAESLVSDLVRMAGPGVDDDLILRAADLANAERIEPIEALDRVLHQHDMETWKADAIAARSATPDGMRGGMDDPGAFADDDMLLQPGDLDQLPDDFKIPFFDDGRGSATPAQVAAEIDHIDHLFQLVEACRT